MGDYDATMRRNNFLTLGIIAFVFCGLFTSVFGFARTEIAEQRHTFLVAAGFCLYFGLVLWGGLRLSRNFCVALLLAIGSCMAALALHFVFFPFALSMCGLWLLFRVRKDFRMRSIGSIAVIGVISIGYCGIILGNHQLTDIFFSSKMLVGQYNTDSFFHIGIAALIKSFGTASTGAHGLVPVQYYTFSHYLFAAMSYVGRIPVADSYAVLYSVVLIPLLFLCVSAAAEHFWISQSLSEYCFRLFFIGLLFAGFLGYGPSSLSNAYAVWPSFFESESYTLSLILLLTMFTVLSMKEHWSQTILAGLCIGLMCLTKASTAVIAYGIYISYLLFIKPDLFHKRVTACLFATLCVILGLKFVAGQSSEIIKFDYLDFFKSYVQGLGGKTLAIGTLHEPWFRRELFRFFIVHFLFSWIALLLLIRAKIYAESDRLFNLSLVLFNLVALVAGFGAVIVLALPAGAVYYFTNVAMFVAFPFIVVLMGRSFVYVQMIQRPRSIAALVVPLAVLCFSIHDLPRQALNLARVAKAKAIALSGDGGGEVYAHYLSQLQAIQKSTLPINLLVYIAKENTGFWYAKTTAACKAQAFVISAVSERPALFGLPDKERCEVAYYGFNAYPDELYIRSAQRRIDDATLRQEAQRLGFAGYVDVGEFGYRVHYLK